MVLDAGSRVLVARRDFSQVRIAPDSDAPAARPLADGEARLAIARFALTANNVTYAAFGEAMHYWDFFPTGDAAWGCVPVWGFATVVESRAAGVNLGQRVWGYLPMGTHLVVQPVRIGPDGFSDGAAHRAELPAAYQRYGFCDADPAYTPALEGVQAVLKPLFMTSFLIDDFLADQGFFGARQVLMSSASSKTAYGTAYCLARRDGAVRIVGLGSPARGDFARSLGVYDQVLHYDALATLDPAKPTVYVDFAGSAALREQIHRHFGAALAYSCAVGATHWAEAGGARDLPGPKPQLFFAPAQLKKRQSPPPDGWGPVGLQKRLGEAWTGFVARVTDPVRPWLTVVERRGADAVVAAWLAQVQGRADATEGTLLAL